MKLPKVYELIGCLFVLFIGVFASVTALAVPAYDGTIVLNQDSGYSFEAIQRGDEWYNWCETKDGYGIFQNRNTGNWEYLSPSDENDSSASSSSSNTLSGLVVGEVYPDMLGIPKGVRPTKSPSPEMPAANNGSKDTSSPELAPARAPLAPVSGAQNLLIICVDYSNQAAFYDATTVVQPVIFGASNSVADYFSDVSYSTVSISPATETNNTANDGVIGWLRLAGNHPNTGSFISTANQQITKDAIIAADPFINYSSYDTNSNGVIESSELSIVIIVSGYERSFGPPSGSSVWGHKWNMAFVGFPSVDGKTVQEYAQFGERHGDHVTTPGVIAHELGHLMLSLPDLYDTDFSNGDSEGIGYLGLMGSGAWGTDSGGDGGSSPTHLCAWSKESLGWGTVTTVSSDQPVSFPKADGNSGSMFRINTSDSNQYFLIENRQFTGYDVGFKRVSQAGASGNGGLAIYHIDTSKTSRWPASNDVNADENDKGVDLEEANEGSLGFSMLDTITKRADTDMFYFSGNNSSFTSSTTPNSQLKNGAPNISITNISTFMDTMTASINFKDPGIIVTGDMDGNGMDEVIIDYGSGTGVWTFMNNSTWMQIHPLPPEAVTTGDIDGNGQDDVIFDYGSGKGIWTFMNNSTWMQIHPLSPETMTTADIDGNGRDDVMIDFGSGTGVWTFMNLSTWLQIHNLSPESMTSGDIDGNGRDDVIIDFGSGTGVWAFMNLSTWMQIHNLSPESVTTGDIDGNGRDDVMIDFGSGTGVWAMMNLSTWMQIHNLSPESVTTGDIDGNGRDDVTIDFGSGTGVWTLMNLSTWMQIHPTSPESVTTGDIDGNGRDDVIIDFGTGPSLNILMNLSAWGSF